MSVRVLVVDDSAFFRQRISEILSQNSGITIVGTARDGVDAIEKNSSLSPDVITMDVEMPKLNGIDAVRQIMRDRPTQVLMISSLTHEGAQVTLQAMEAGAVDYLTKDMRAWMGKSKSLDSELISRIIALGKSKHFVRSSFLSTAAPVVARTRAPSKLQRTTSSSVPLKPGLPQRAVSKKAVVPRGCRSHCNRLFNRWSPLRCKKF